MNERAKKILHFWFNQTSHKERFSKNEAFDQKIRAIFFDDYQKAKKIAIEAINYRYHEKLNQDQIMFIFLPFMHSEDFEDQIYCGQLIDNYFKDNPNYEQAKKYSIIHKDIIEKFGRFPYRNKVLKRVSTKEEVIYLKSTHHDFFNI